MTGDSTDSGNGGPPENEMRPQRGAMTQNGTGCKNPALANGFCWMHGGIGHKPESLASTPPLSDKGPDRDDPDASDAMQTFLPDKEPPPDNDFLESDVKPVFFVEDEDAGEEPEPPSASTPSDSGISSFEEDPQVMIDPSDFEFAPDPEPPAEDSEDSPESQSSDIHAIGEDEEEALAQSPEEEVVDLDPSALELEIVTPSLDQPQETETAFSPEFIEQDQEDELADADIPPEGDIQMPETFRIELESEAEGAAPEPHDRPATPEETPEEKDADEPLELEMVDDELSLSLEDSVEDKKPSDDLEQEDQAAGAEDDIDSAHLELEIEPPRESDETSLPTPGPDSEIPDVDIGYAPEDGASDEEGEKVVAPPQFDLFEELPGEDWIEIEVNIEDGGYSTGDLDEFAPDLMSDGEASQEFQTEDTLVEAPKAPVSEALFDEEHTETDDFPTESEARAERRARPHATQVEPTHYVPAAEAETGLRRRISLPLPIFAGLLLFIAGVTYGLATMFRPSAPVDAGDAAIRLVDIESQFVQNQTAGNLLVVTGRAINDYDHPRSFIRVTGKVYTSDRFVQSISVFCGNNLTPDELETLPISEMVKQLLSPSGRYQRNLNIASGSAAPLMIVFPIAPEMADRLDSYTVEVIESKPS